ncbi:hypothetical protein NTGBS_550008 [Candidatus Nitrotoga sp. BS]|uniref:hypothetical protein n=1 Tax=Candidatus Nitrotoga sp. BS TaxID=2890408 RepID=UPI001EF22B10|nr:hypothetical protein [Candidatus Nitrotoga sp. BS]CAH1204866.1 hypothetical protein NTGBS_550008 [Candidatus Nitrotoga sp. BS]
MPVRKKAKLASRALKHNSFRTNEQSGFNELPDAEAARPVAWENGWGDFVLLGCSANSTGVGAMIVKLCRFIQVDWIAGSTVTIN